MTLRVAFVIDDLRAGGATRQLALLAPALRPRVEPVVHVLSSLTGPPAESLRASGVAVRVHARGATPRVVRLARALAAGDVHVVHGWLDASDAWAAAAAAVVGRPAVLAVQSDRLRLRGVRGALLRAALRHAPAVTVNSRAGAAHLTGVVGVPPHRVVRVPNWVDTRAAERARRDASSGGRPADGTAHVGFAGRLVALKRVDRVIDALARLVAHGRDVHLDVVGDGPERAGLQARVRDARLAGRVTFHGTLADPLPVMARFDVLVLPSELEGLPNVVLEALALGVPVVATPVGDVPDVVRDGSTGRLLRRAEDLADAIAAVLDDGRLRERVRHDGPARIARAFSLDAAVSKLVELYERLSG